MTRRVKSSYRGVNKLRRTLRRIDQAMGPGTTKPVQREIADGADRILARMLSRVRRRTGRLAGLLRRRVARDGLTARIGLLTKRAERLGFHARFQEFGTRGSPERNIPPQPADPFIGPAVDAEAPGIVRKARRAIDQVLRRASL